MSRNFLTEAYRKLRQRLRQGDLYAGEDALNDAFCRLWGGGYDPGSPDEGERLLFVAAHRRQISLWRRERTFARVPLAETLPADPPPDSSAEEKYRRVSRLMEACLTPLQREILVRRDIDGEPYREIAQKLGMQEAAVRMQLSRARKAIRETYKKTENDDTARP